MDKLIPPYLFFICIILMLVIKQCCPGTEIIGLPHSYAGLVFIAFGFWMTRKIRHIYTKVDTEIHTFKKPRKLITDGLFSYTRNPIYLGFTLALLGMWMTLGNSMSAIGVLIFFLAAHFWYIPFEENRMEEEFGTDYLNYKNQVRRWI